MVSRNAYTRAKRVWARIAFIVVFVSAAGDGARAEESDDTDLAPFFETLGRTGPRHLPTPPQWPTITARELLTQLEAHGLTPPPLQRGSPPLQDLAAVERRVLALINSHRTERGLDPVREHGELADRARAHAAAVAAGTDRFDHSGFHGRVGSFLGGLFGYRAAGEILAGVRRPAEPAAGALASWRESAIHRDILEGDYARVGIGVARAGDGTHYFTVLFLR